MASIFKKGRVKEAAIGQQLQYNLRQAAVQLGVGLSTIKDWIQRGKLQAYKIDGVGKNFISHKEMERFVEVHAESMRFVESTYSDREAI
jgi:excisionase family DNA binding protein